MKFDLQLRDLSTGKTFQKTFESVEEGKQWLRQRPQGIDVLGVASHHVPKDVSNELRAAMRPLDDAERTMDQKREEERDAAVQKAAEERRQREAAEAARHAAAIATADPNRPMQLRWRFNTGLALIDPADPRPITDEARAAVDAWIAERNEWVKSRGQVVGDASIEVWPGPIPEGKGAERVISGTFIPVSAPKN